MLDVSALLDDKAFCAPFTVLRKTESVNDKGRAEYVDASMPMIGVVQPASARELDRLPEGERDKETLTVYTRQPLRVGNLADGTSADCVVYNGARYTVAAVETWSGYTRALAQKELDNASGVVTQKTTDEGSNE